MPTKDIVIFDTESIYKTLEKRFGKGSPAQYAWSKIVDDGSDYRKPANTGRFIEHSKQQSESLYAQGEIVYSAPPESNFPYLPIWLWEGRSPSGARIISRYTTAINPLAGGQWTRLSANDNYSKWRAELQGMIKKGKV